MQNAALAAVHRREQEGLATLLHPLRGGGGAHAQLLNPQTAIVVRVEADQRVILGRHAQHLHGEMLQSQQQLGFVLQQHFGVITDEVDHQFRILEVLDALIRVRKVGVEVEAHIVDCLV